MSDRLLPLLCRVQLAAPRTTLVWVTPPFRIPMNLPSTTWLLQWLPMFVRVSQDLGFYRPAGPMHLLDAYSLGMGCLPWCFREDATHLGRTANQALLQQLANLHSLALELQPVSGVR